MAGRHFKGPGSRHRFAKPVSAARAAWLHVCGTSERKPERKPARKQETKQKGKGKEGSEGRKEGRKGREAKFAGRHAPRGPRPLGRSVPYLAVTWSALGLPRRSSVPSS